MLISLHCSLELEWVATLLQGTFPTQGLNLGLLHCRQILYQLSYEGRFPRSFQVLMLNLEDLRQNFSLLKESIDLLRF